MSRPRCYFCFKQLMYVKGIPVFDIYKAADGIEHRVHKECLKHEKLENELERATEFRRWAKRGNDDGGYIQ